MLHWALTGYVNHIKTGNHYVSDCRKYVYVILISCFVPEAFLEL